MRAIDTNVLVRLIVRDDETQARIADSFVSNNAWISHVVLAEATWVLGTAYRLSHQEIAIAIDMLLHHESLSVQDADVVAAALNHYRHRPSLGFSDCLIVEIARKAGHIPIGTFDRNLSRVEGTQKL